jgi:hypothetical protein
MDCSPVTASQVGHSPSTASRRLSQPVSASFSQSQPFSVVSSLSDITAHPCLMRRSCCFASAKRTNLPLDMILSLSVSLLVGKGGIRIDRTPELDLQELSVLVKYKPRTEAFLLCISQPFQDRLYPRGISFFYCVD